MNGGTIATRRIKMILEPRHLPNIISVLRILLVYPVVQMLLARRYDWALALFVLAGLSDALDGFLAKHYHWQSRLGSFLDPAADKLLLLACFVVGGWQGLMPLWLVVAAVLRDIVIVLELRLTTFSSSPTMDNPCSPASSTPSVSFFMSLPSFATKAFSAFRRACFTRSQF